MDSFLEAIGYVDILDKPHISDRLYPITKLHISDKPLNFIYIN